MMDGFWILFVKVMQLHIYFINQDIVYCAIR
ncbi:hypothetical protein VCHENC02_3491, partial [Vibrio harveyi]